MTLEDLHTLVDYHYWARDRMLDAVEHLSAEQFLQDLQSSFRSVRDTLAHLHGAEWVWYSRWQGVSPAALPALDIFDRPAAVRPLWHEHEVRVRAFVDGLEKGDVSRRIEYKNFAGAESAQTIGEMFQHVVNHASYHRGQLTTMLRQLGAAPPKSMDLIAFHRERSQVLR